MYAKIAITKLQLLPAMINDSRVLGMCLIMIFAIARESTSIKREHRGCARVAVGYVPRRV